MGWQADLFTIDSEIEIEDHDEEDDLEEVSSEHAGGTENDIGKRIFNKYLKEVSKIPLLGKGGDFALRREIIRTEYLSCFPVSHKEAEEIFQKLENLKNRFVNANLRLVIPIAKRYLYRGLSFLDLIQEGNIGLMKAADRFDPERKVKFITHSYWWIRQAILSAIDLKGRTIKIPSTAVLTMNKYKKARKFLIWELKREPSDEEVAKSMGVKKEFIKEIKRIIACSQISSLDDPLSEEESRSRKLDFVPSKGDSAEEKAMRNNNLDNFRKKLRFLTSKERKVITLRLGIDGKPHTLHETGKILGGFTREYARKLEARALEKLEISNIKRYVMSNR